MKKRLLKTFIILTTIITLNGCKQIERGAKSFKSANSGLKRKITVYSLDGKELRSYQGVIDIANKQNNVVKFDLDGKRYIFYNCSVIVEEVE